MVKTGLTACRLFAGAFTGAPPFPHNRKGFVLRDALGFNLGQPGAFHADCRATVAGAGTGIVDCCFVRITGDDETAAYGTAVSHLQKRTGIRDAEVAAVGGVITCAQHPLAGL